MSLAVRAGAPLCGFVWHPLLCLIGPPITHAADEIQVYNADINEVGQFSIQQHFNYTITGIPTPAYPGALDLEPCTERNARVRLWRDPLARTRALRSRRGERAGAVPVEQYQAASAVCDSRCRQEGLLLRPELRIRLSDLALRAFTLCHGSQADHRLAQSPVGVHHQSDHRFCLGPVGRSRLRSRRPACAQARRGPFHRHRVLFGPWIARQFPVLYGSNRTSCLR